MRKIVSIMKTSFICLSVAASFVCALYVIGAVASEDADFKAADSSLIIEKKDLSEESPPLWQEMWEEARMEAQGGNISRAISLYHTLLNIKPNIITAKWELCRLYVSIAQLDRAVPLLDALLDMEPENQEFLMLAGEVAMQQHRFDSAARYFGQVYEAEPLGTNALDALRGQINAFKQGGRVENAILLLEYLFMRQDEDVAVLRELAYYAAQENVPDRALSYFKRLLQLQKGDSLVLFDAAQFAADHELTEIGISFLKDYLAIDNEYLPFHTRLAEYYLKNNKPADGLVHLKKMYNSNLSTDTIGLTIGDIYLEHIHRPDKALMYYEKISGSERDQGDKKIQQKIEQIKAQLAAQYLPIVENGAEAKLWDDLDTVTLKKESIFEKMAFLLHREGKLGLETRLIEMLCEKSTSSQKYCFRLASLKKEADELWAALTILKKLETAMLPSSQEIPFLSLFLEVKLALGQEQEVLDDLLVNLSTVIEDVWLSEQALMLAGKLGLVDTLDSIWQLLARKYPEKTRSISLDLTYVEALRLNGRYDIITEVYQALLAKTLGNLSEYARVSCHKSETLQEQGMSFEAEQILRQVLANDIQVESTLVRLVRLAIEEGDFVKAEDWLTSYRNAETYLTDHKQRLIDVLEFEIYFAQKQYKKARKILNNTILPTLAEKKHVTSRKEIILYDLRVDYFLKDWESLRRKIEKYDVEIADEKTVLLDLLSQHEINDTLFHYRQLVKENQLSFFDLLNISVIYKFYGAYERALAMVSLAQELLPDSVSARKMKIELLSKLFRYDEALAIVNELIDLFPDESYYLQNRLNIEFKGGYFKKVVERITREQKKKKVEQPGTVEPDSDVQFGKKLIFARALWAEGRKEEAIAVYDALLAVPVNSMFLEKMEVEKVNFHLPPLKKSFLNYVTFTRPTYQESITEIMQPSFVAGNRGSAIDEIAASLYGKYKWQKLIKKEVTAKKSVGERNFFRAEKEYLDLLEEDGAEESLVDLAGVYKRLGLYGKEAEIYALMKDKSPLYPGLDEMIDANRLKRAPRIATNFSEIRKRGRDAYKNLKKRGMGIEIWLMPYYDQEFSFSITHNTYKEYNSDKKADSKRIVGKYSTYYKDTFDVNLSLGSEKTAEDAPDEFLYKIEAIGRVSREIDMFIRLGQDIVDDNLLSTTDSILYRDFETGFKLDLFSRWFLGTDFRFREYSDDNSQNRVKFWTSYHLFGEQSQVKLLYSFENIENSEGNIIVDGQFRDSPEAIDRAYWSPSRYWQHVLSLHYTHLFESSSNIGSPLSYLTLGYSLGYENNTCFTHEFGVNIFLEINRHFLLKGDLVNYDSQNYNKIKGGLSLIYRW